MRPGASTSASAPWRNHPTRKIKGVGIYDRDYYRRSQPGFSLRMPQSMVVSIIIVNVVLWFLNGLLFQDTNALTERLALTSDTLWHPWLWWQFITYGFVHSPQPMHIIMNMVGLWFLGRYVEQLYGSKEFLRIYMVMIIVGSVCYAIGAEVANAISHQDRLYGLIGASGAVSGITILFILNFPQVTLVLFPIPIPVKAWVIGVLLVLMNLLGAVTPESGNIAYSVHLVGIIFAFLYHQYRWNLGLFFKKIINLPKALTRPKFHVHHPDDESQEPDLNTEVDRILEKISREGENSLTRKERQTLETASRQYQKRRHD
jgi:membrane associated rhomboid family serine protease